MTAGSILLGLALLAAVIIWLALPFWSSVADRRERRRSRRALLLEQKEAILTELRGLDFDYETGKLPQALYQGQRAQLVADAADTLRQLDVLAGRPAAGEGTVSAAIEAAVAQARQRIGKEPARPETGPQATSAAIEAAVARARQDTAAAGKKGATRRAGPANGRPRFCPQCGQPVDPDDKFCAACGHRLEPAAIATQS